MHIHIEREASVKGLALAGKDKLAYAVVSDEVILWGVFLGVWIAMAVIAFLAGEPIPASLYMGVALFALLAWRLLRWRRQLRRVRRHLGQRLTTYATITDECIAVGTRDLSESRWTWGLLVGARIRRDRLELDLAGTRVYIYLHTLADAERAQIKRRIRIALGDGVDACPHCNYDLRATPGPRCPECGAAIASEQPAPETQVSPPGGQR